MKYSKVLNTLVSLGVHIGDSYIYKHYFSELNQFMFCIRNEFFIFNVKKSLFFLKRALYYISNLSNTFSRLLFYHSLVEISYNFKFIMLYIVKHKGNSSIINSYWIPGLISNYRVCFRNLLYKFLRIEGKFKNKIKSKKLKSSLFYTNNSLFLRYILIKLIYLTYEKSDLKRDWFSEFHKLWLFWKVYIFLRSFKHVFNIPDTLILINPSDSFHRALEFSKTHKLPVISTIDSSSSWYGITYPIPGNDDSIALSFFFFSLFINVYINSKIKHSYKVKL